MALTQVAGGMLASSGLNASALTTGTLPKAQLPAGTVLQVVQYSSSTQVTNTSNTVWADVGLSGAITPTSSTSKILVAYNLQAGNRTPGLGEMFRIKRAGSVVFTQQQFSQVGDVGMGETNGFGGMSYLGYLDAPSTTSSVTYSAEVKHRTGNTGTFIINDPTGSNATPVYSFLTLMEIAA